MGENGNRDLGHQACVRDRADAYRSRITSSAISDTLLSKQLEFMCIVEGICPSTSNTLQCRFSYTCDDIVFNAFFQQCVYRCDDGHCEVDFNAFHELTEVHSG